MNGARRAWAALCRVLIACLMSGLLVHPAAAALDWEPASPRSLVAGDSPWRWPAQGSGRGLRADLVFARPFSWPQVSGAGARLAYAARDGSWVIGSGVFQLRAEAYRESRLTLGVGRALDRHELMLAASVLQVAAGEPILGSRTGAALDLGWDLRLGRVAFAARASGVLETNAARALAEPREFGLAVRTESSPLLAELRVVDGSRGRRLALGLITELIGPLAIGAGWSSVEPALRLLIELKRGGLALSGGMAWHSDLPPTQLWHVAHAAREGAAAPDAGASGPGGGP